MNPLEKLTIRAAFSPADNNDAAQVSDYFSLVDHEDLLFVCSYGDGSAGNDLHYLVYQATDNAGSDVKVCNCLSTGRIFSMHGATLAAYQALTKFTKETQAVADEEWAPADNGEDVGVDCLWIRASDLDAGFTHIMVTVEDSNAAKINAGLFIGLNPKYPAGATLMQDPLT